MSQPPNQPCSSWGNHLSKECMETSLVCIAQNLYGPEPQQMLNGILKLMCRKYVQQHGNDLQFESDLLSFIPNSREAETSIAHFPRDVLQRIAYFLRDDPKTLGILAQVCRTWYVFLSSFICMNIIPRQHFNCFRNGYYNFFCLNPINTAFSIHCLQAVRKKRFLLLLLQ